MNNSISTKGSCLCGAVTVSVNSASNSVGACHCNNCRKWSGGPLIAVECGVDVSFSGSEYIKTFASSEWAERGFCSKCGSNLFYKLNETGEYHIPAGILEIESQLKLDHQIFIEQKPKYYSFSNETIDMTGEEVFALYENN